MSTINHIESHFQASNQILHSNPSTLTFLENIDRLLNLTNSTYSGIQYTGIRGLNDFSCTSFKMLVIVFSKFRSMKSIFKLVNSPDEKVRSETLSLLWNFSAEESLKVKMFEERILNYIGCLFNYQDENLLLRTSAIIQNLCEFRFEKGAINQNQIKIVSQYKDLLSTIIQRSNHQDVRIKFLSCNTLCNLSMNEENRKLFQQMNIFQEVIGEFNKNYLNDIELPSSFNWVTLQPLLGLISSKDTQVQIFILYCVLSFSLSEKYNRRLWRVLANNHGIESLLKLKKSKIQLVSELSTKICTTLKIEKQKIETLKHDSNECLENDISKLFNNENMFPDLIIKCKDKPNFYLHRSICVSRCPKLKIILDNQSINNDGGGDGGNGLKSSTGFEKEFLNLSGIGEKIISNINYGDRQIVQLELELYETFYEIAKWIYGIHSNSNLSSEVVAKSVMKIAYFLEVQDIIQECEYSLWHHIDLNNCSEILNLSLQCNSKQLENVTVEFILRNLDSIYFGNAKSDFLNHTFNQDLNINKLWYSGGTNNWTKLIKNHIINSYQLQQQQFKIEIHELNNQNNSNKNNNNNNINNNNNNNNNLHFNNNININTNNIQHYSSYNDYDSYR
ncbi:hypothetical protein ACTFIW_011552 [Dictyostelium discoideum]